VSALGLLAQAGSLRGAQTCPHPQRLASCAIRIDAGRPFILCPICKEALELLIAGWHAHRIGARDVYAQMFALGYTRGDALRFLLQLFADRLRLRAGLLSEADL
jgi:hypothetical protein